MSATAVAGRPPWGWRLVAWLALAMVALMSLPVLLAAALPGLVSVMIAWIAIAGMLAYAHGHRARPLWFWRLFAPLVSLFIMWDLGAYLGRLGATAGAGLEMRGPALAVLVVWLPLNISACVALLRHAELLRTAQRSAMRNLEGVFA